MGQPMSSDEHSNPNPASVSMQERAPQCASSRLRRRYLPGALIALCIGAAAWLAYGYLNRAELGPDTDDSLALSVIGGWWNIVGDRHLMLDWEGHRATLTDYSSSEIGIQSVGTWRTSKDIVIVRVQGAAGALEQTLELVGTDAEMFLAPTPAAQARLLESWIADHDEDAEDMSPADSTARETRAGVNDDRKTWYAISNEYASRVVEASGDASATRVRGAAI